MRTSKNWDGARCPVCFRGALRYGVKRERYCYRGKTLYFDQPGAYCTLCDEGIICGADTMPVTALIKAFRRRVDDAASRDMKG